MEYHEGQDIVVVLFFFLNITGRVTRFDKN